MPKIAQYGNAPSMVADEQLRLLVDVKSDFLRGDQKVVGSDSAEHAAEYVSLIPASLRRSDGFGLTLGDRGAGRSLLSDSQERARRDAVDRP